MVLPRASSLGGVLRSQCTRSAGAQARTKAWQQIGRRTYASGHGHAQAKASSDIPWLIGSLVVTVPSATWLWQQGPEKKPHGHGHGTDILIGGDEEKSEDSGESKSEEPQGTGGDSPDESAGDQAEDSDSSEHKDSDPEKVKVGGADNEGTSNESGAKNPAMDDNEKSTKGEGVAETAKIHGTVDTSRNLKGTE